MSKKKKYKESFWSSLVFFLFSVTRWLANVMLSQKGGKAQRFYPCVGRPLLLHLPEETKQTTRMKNAISVLGVILTDWRRSSLHNSCKSSRWNNRAIVHHHESVANVASKPRLMRLLLCAMRSSRCEPQQKRMRRTNLQCQVRRVEHFVVKKNSAWQSSKVFSCVHVAWKICIICTVKNDS